MKYYISFQVLLLLFTFSCKQHSSAPLPIYNPSDLNAELVDKSLLNKNENHRIAEFTLVNQNGDTITQDDYKDKVYVADFFFTRCPGICPIMTDNMEKLQEEFADNRDFMLLSHSVTPIKDSIYILRHYADDHAVIDSKWNITTGNKKHIYELARKNYFAVVEQGDGGLQDFIHTPNFILIDKEKQIRGIYDGTDDGEIQRIIGDIKILLNSN